MKISFIAIKSDDELITYKFKIRELIKIRMFTNFWKTVYYSNHNFPPSLFSTIDSCIVVFHLSFCLWRILFGFENKNKFLARIYNMKLTLTYSIGDLHYVSTYVNIVQIVPVDFSFTFLVHVEVHKPYIIVRLMKFRVCSDRIWLFYEFSMYEYVLIYEFKKPLLEDALYFH